MFEVTKINSSRLIYSMNNLNNEVNNLNENDGFKVTTTEITSEFEKVDKINKNLKK